MSAPTPDRAALAERLRKIAGVIEHRYGDPLSGGAPPYACNEWRVVMQDAAAALAAPAVPPSVAEAREDVIGLYHEVGTSQIVAERRADALIAAVRAATVAEAVRVVAAVPRCVLTLNLWQGTASLAADLAANGAWVGQTAALDALRALEVQP